MYGTNKKGIVLKSRKVKYMLVLMAVLMILMVPFSVQAASFSGKAPVLTVKKNGLNATICWSKQSGLTGYQIYQTNSSGKSRKLLKRTSDTSFTVRGLEPGKAYYYRARGYQKKRSSTKYTKYSKVLKVTVELKGPKSTLKKLLLTGLEPVGTTMYVWGGGWNKADTGAGKEARSIGVSPQWEKFFKKQTSSYDYKKTRYQISNGLDCSGYIGWCVYNILNTTDGKAGYVMSSKKMAGNFASRGWGTYTAKKSVKNYRAGDIMSSGGHVWMVVGQCSDGSVVLLHSSPPGVQLAGTPSKKGKTESKAVKLASSYMKKYYPEWYKKYPNCAKDTQYLTQYAQMRWNITGAAIMTDPDGYRNMSADKILKDLFAGRGTPTQ